MPPVRFTQPTSHISPQNWEYCILKSFMIRLWNFQHMQTMTIFASWLYFVSFRTNPRCIWSASWITNVYDKFCNATPFRALSRRTFMQNCRLANRPSISHLHTYLTEPPYKYDFMANIVSIPSYCHHGSQFCPFLGGLCCNCYGNELGLSGFVTNI